VMKNFKALFAFSRIPSFNFFTMLRLYIFSISLLIYYVESPCLVLVIFFLVESEKQQNPQPIALTM
jgi:hypothetical protein